MSEINRRIQIKYTLVQGTFWIFMAAFSGFMTPILQEKGFSDIQIGILNADKCISMMIFQTILSYICDKYAKYISLKYILSVLGFVGVIVIALFYYIPVNFFGALILFLLMGASVNCLSTIIDLVSIQYINHGQNISYTFARGAGSLTYALSSLPIGQFSNRYGADQILKLQILILSVLILLFLMLDRIDYSCHGTVDKINNAKEKKENETVHSIGYLLKNYPKYTLFLLGSVLALVSYKMGNTFLNDVVYRVGGNDFDFGICNFVLAIAEVPTAIVFMKLKQKFSLERLMIVFAVFNTLQTAGTIFATNRYMVIGCQAFEMLGYGLSYALIVYFIIENLPASDVAKANSLIAVSTSGVGIAAGTLLSGWIKSQFGLTALLVAGSIAGLFSIAVMLLLNLFPFNSTLTCKGVNC